MRAIDILFFVSEYGILFGGYRAKSLQVLGQS